MPRKKIAVIGAGNVGASTAQYLAMQDFADVVMVDIPETGTMPKGKALDLLEAGPILGYDSKVAGATDYDIVRGADLVVVTAGFPRKPGMDRMDLWKKNADVVGGVTDKVLGAAPEAILLMVTNPLDIMTYLAWKRSKRPRSKVFGMAGVLDSARYATFIAMELGCSVKDVRAMVLGGHGDQMVPIPRYSTVSGIPITALIKRDRIQAINDRTRKGGGEIVELLKTGSAYYAPAASIVAMVRSIIMNERRILPSCVRLEGGEYGVTDGVFMGVPAVLGENGVEKVIDLELEPEEKAAVDASIDVVRKGMKELDAVLG